MPEAARRAAPYDSDTVEPEWEPAREPDARRAWEQVLRPLAAGVVEDARELSELAMAFIRPRIPELFPDSESEEENRASTEASVRAVAAMVSDGSDPEAVELPAATVAYAQSGVRRGVPFPALLRSYRLGHQAVSDEILRRLAPLAPDPADFTVAVRLVSHWIFAYVDTALVAAELTYDAERERWMRSAAASRAETIEAVLAGRQRDPGIASTRLGYRIDRDHIAAVAWLDAATEGSNPLPVLESAIGQVGDSAGSEGVLVHPLGLLAVAAWFGSGAGFDEQALADLGFESDAAPGVRVAVGMPGHGLEGFRRSYRQAREARRVAGLAGREAGTVIGYDQVAISALASVDLAQAAEFVERELGPLAGDDQLAQRLAATLRAYLDEQGSRSRAARRLGIHENTVSYRVRQAEELLGRYIEQRPLELRVALELAGVISGIDDDPAAAPDDG